MTPLRQRMTEDMQVRNLSPHTQTSYVQQVSLFARHFNKSPEKLGPEEIRTYQVYLTNEKKLAAGSVLIAVAALRFLYKVSLKRQWPFDEVIPAPKKPQKLPVVLSPSEVVHFLECVGSTKHRAILTTYRRSADGHPRRSGQRAEGSICNALAQVAGDTAQLLACCAAEELALRG